MFKDFVQYIKKNSGLKLSITRQKVNSDEYAKCMYAEGKNWIIIDKDVDDTAAIQLLIHELAHAYDCCEHEHDNPLWGEAYCEAYKLYQRYIEDNDE